MKRIFPLALSACISFAALAAPNHECGIAMVRLFKPVTYYQETYGDAARGIHILRLLMEKQRNRGQDSVGISALQFDMPAGKSYMNRLRATDKNALVMLYCKSGRRSGFAKQTLEQLGYSNVVNAGGINDVLRRAQTLPTAGPSP